MTYNDTNYTASIEGDVWFHFEQAMLQRYHALQCINVFVTSSDIEDIVQCTTSDWFRVNQGTQYDRCWVQFVRHYNCNLYDVVYDQQADREFEWYVESDAEELDALHGKYANAEDYATKMMNAYHFNEDNEDANWSDFASEIVDWLVIEWSEKMDGIETEVVIHAIE